MHAVAHLKTAKSSRKWCLFNKVFVVLRPVGLKCYDYTFIPFARGNMAERGATPMLFTALIVSRFFCITLTFHTKIALLHEPLAATKTIFCFTVGSTLYICTMCWDEC